MPRIFILPPSLASQIAAGEVVERPASAVKELVENAIDAGASRCDVEIDGGGISRLSVSDDGCGMSADDAALCLERHATSKIRALEDLTSIATFGFRGEALPSIASVSRFCLRTRPKDADAGIELVSAGGSSVEARPAGMAPGTLVEVKDLFFNVVARRKFLRSSGTESGHVTDVVEDAALGSPGLTFTLTRDGRRVRQWLRASGREERARSSFNDELSPTLGERGPLRIEAYLSRPERARTGAAGLKLFVNGRPVRDRALAYSVAQSYGSVLERGRYPRGVVYLELPTALVDVNVHPQKAEVRFADPRAVGDALYHVLSVSLAKAFSLPAPSRSPWSTRQPLAAVEPPMRLAPRDPLPEVRGSAGARQEPRAGASTTARPERVDPDLPMEVRDSANPIAPSADTRWAQLRFIAQVRLTYLLCEGDDGLYVIDQHAAAERVSYDRLRRQYLARTVSAQTLLFPLSLELRPQEVELLESRAVEFGALGLDVRVRSRETVSVHSVPKLLTRASPEVLVRDLLTEVSRSGDRAFSDAVDRVLATMACHGSVRAGDALGEKEAAALLAALDKADFAGHCPHGRPVVAHTSWAELERRVGRR